MADTKLADLNDRTTTAGTDIVYAVSDPSGSAADNKVSLNNLFKRGEVTTSSPVIDAAQTWNASGTTFTGLRFNAAGSSDANSASASLLMDLQVGGSSKFKVSKLGNITIAGGHVLSTDALALRITDANGVASFLTRADFSFIPTASVYSWGNASTFYRDLMIGRAGAANLRLGEANTGASSATVTITIAPPGVVTWSSNFGHMMSAGTPVIFTTTGALPTGITAGTTYYAVPTSDTTFQIATSVANATAAVPVVITTSGSQSGTHTATRYAMTHRLSVQNVTGVNNIAAPDFFIQGSQGTGTGAGGSIIFQVAPAGSSGTAQNALVNALIVDMVSSTQPILRLGGTTTAFPGLARSGSGLSCVLADFSDNTGFNVASVTATGGGLASTSLSRGVGLRLGSTNNIRWSSTTAHDGTADLFLERDDANKLALRNSTNAQTFNLYGTYTDASNYERLSISRSGVYFVLDSQAAGTGTRRQMILRASNFFIQSAVGGSTTIGTETTDFWTFNSSGHFVAATDNTYDIGLSGASRPRNVYVGGTVTAGGLISTTSDFRAGSASYFYWNSRSQMSSPADGNILLQNLAANGFDRLQFGGTTSSFPALKRVSANLQVIAADNAGSAGLIVGNQALATTATDGFLYVPTCAGTPTGTPTTQTGTAPIVVDTTNNKLYFYSGGSWRDAGP